MKFKGNIQDNLIEFIYITFKYLLNAFIIYVLPQ